MNYLHKEAMRTNEEYFEKFGTSEDLIQAARVAANRGASDDLVQLKAEALKTGKPVDPVAFVHRFHPPKN